MRQKHSNYFTKSREKIIRKNLLATLVYSDIFDYPLSANQLFQFSGVAMTRKEFLTVVKTIPHKISGSSLYYFLPKREAIVAKRIQREKISKKKIRRLTSFVKILSFLPTISFIGISGSLALMNADTMSDSDIFIIAKSHTLWLTRFFVYIVLSLFSLKRSKKNTGSAICANMFVSASLLEFPKEKRNLYLAHEILQLVPLYNSEKQYEKFLGANTWITQYFPNTSIKKIQKRKSFSLWDFLLPIEFVLWKAQIWYMRNKKTREVTTSNRIAFHPIDYEGIILYTYEKRLKGLGFSIKYKG